MLKIDKTTKLKYTNYHKECNNISCLNGKPPQGKVVWEKLKQTTEKGWSYYNTEPEQARANEVDNHTLNGKKYPIFKGLV